MSDEKTVPYDESPFPGWAAAVNTWQWHPTKTSGGEVVGWWKEGDCLRCHHPTQVTIGLIEAFTVETTAPVYAECECKFQHAAGQVGCGASAEVDGPGHD